VTPDAQPSVDFGAPSDVYPAYDPPIPQVALGGGGVIAHPRVVEVFFADDLDRGLLVDFTTKLGTSREWAAMTGEYGAGAFTVAPPIVLAEATPSSLSDVDVRAMITSALDGTHPEWGDTDAATLAQSIYVLHVPGGVDYTFGGARACEQFYGYHAALSIGSAPTQYAVITSCLPPSYVPTALDLDTATISHELIETVTDPQPGAGYAILASGVHWAVEYGAEVGDLCEISAASWYRPDDLDYYIQRSFSNAAMSGYHEYCVPALPTETVFFAAAPKSTDAIAKLDQPITIDLDLISDRPTGGPFSIEALDDTSVLEADKGTVLDLQLDRTSGQNGEILHLTIVPRSIPDSGFALFTLRSTLGDVRTYWKGVVGITP
jgi:hypothetical protein